MSIAALRIQKSRWALLKTRFRNSLSPLDENRERNLMDLQQTANGRLRIFILRFSCCLFGNELVLPAGTTSPVIRR